LTLTSERLNLDIYQHS